MEDKKHTPKIFTPEEFGISKSKEERLRVSTILENERIKQGITLEQLSEKTGISYTQLFQIANLKYIPSFTSVYKIAQALGKNVTINIH